MLGRPVGIREWVRRTPFRHAEAAGKARVVWNWMHPVHVETGFVVIR